MYFGCRQASNDDCQICGRIKAGKPRDLSAPDWLAAKGCQALRSFVNCAIMHKDKRVISAGTAIAVGQFSINVLNNVLAAIGKVSRKIAIGVENESGLKWEALNVFFRYGASDITLPMKVENAKALLYTARKSHSIFMTGTSAVFTYSMSDGNTLAVLFVVPYNKLSFSNWWNVKVYNGRKMADWRMWKELYNKNPFPANAWHQRNLGYGVKVKGYMTNAGEATLQIRISKA
ncbi:Cytolysin-3 [Exaiptasia diaphana]|nr:Cytolysin-3 [Exaiptasia diaphana]